MAHVTYLTAVFLLVALIAQAPTSAQLSCPHIPACDNCQANSTCENNSCVCSSGGKNDFHCYNPHNVYACYLLADPKVKSLNHHSANIPFFGNSKLVQLATDRPEGGKCSIEVYGWTKKVKGKFFLDALYFIDTYIPDSGTHETLVGGLRGYETGCETTYQYHAIIAGGLTGNVNAFETPGTVVWDGTPGRPNGFIYSVIEGGFFQVESPKCGYKFALRTRHSGYADRPHGFWFEVDKDYNPTGLNPSYSLSDPLCLDPDATHGENYTTLQLETGIEDITHALIYYAYVNTGFLSVTFPGYLGPLYLFSIQVTLRYCAADRLQKLFDNAGFAFTSPHFINCIGSNDDEYSFAITSLVTSFCSATVTVCNTFLTLVNDNCAYLYSTVPELAAFVADNCTSVV